MLQTNLIFGIQQKIKDSKRLKASSVLEENEALGTQKAEPVKNEILLENYYNPSIASGIYEQVKNSQKETKIKTALMTEAFHINKIEKKLGKDISYFNYLFENFVDDFFKEDYQMLLENIFEDTIKLYQECDVTPRVISPAIESNELNESQIVDLYKNSLNNSIKNNYTKPLLSGKITELYEGEIRTLTKKLIEEGVTADVDQVRIYLPFEETLYQFNRSIMVPEIAESRMEAYMESTTVEYNEMLEESASDLLQGLEKKIKLLTSMISPNMFSKAVDAEGVDAPKMAGISIAVDKNFNDEEECDDEGVCPAEAIAGDEEAQEEMSADEEAIELDAEGEDIVGAEEDAKDNLGQASTSEDHESSGAEGAAELSASESSDEDDQPGAIEVDLPSESGSLNSGGHADNDSDVAIQGTGNDSGETASVSAELPGKVPADSATNVSDENLSASIETGTSDGAASLPGSASGDSSADTNSSDVGLQGSGNIDGETISSGSVSLPGSSQSNDTAGVTNSGDESLSSGATPAETSVKSAEVVGADGDDSNAMLGVSAEAPEAEVNTETPSEEAMDKEPVEDSSLPMPRI